jgi:sugar phosphate isomerase/epimerase
MILSCTSEMVPGDTLTDKAGRLRDWGYGGISVFADRASWNDEKLDELVNLERNTGVHPCEFLFMSPDGGKLMSQDRLERVATKKLYTEAAEVCAKIGAVTEIEYLYGPQTPLPLFDIYRQMTAGEEEAFLEAYRAIAAPVIGTKGAVLLEGINRYESPYMNSIRDCKHVADKSGIAESGVLADFFHMSIEEDDIAESIAAMGGSIRHVHLGDSNRKMPGLGHIDWKTGFRALKKQEYDGFINLECSTMGDPHKAIPEAAEFLNRLLAEI